MSKHAVGGLCINPCELDQFLDAKAETGAMAAIESVFVENGSEDVRRLELVQKLHAWHAEVIADSIELAGTTPCQGRSEEGYKMPVLFGGRPVHCPLIVHLFRTTIE
ncbi:MAG TPA: hypothetical protein VG992_00380 [Candidatus Saccharimonadales bacterium]|nr:hypothetical protein [Candidatus Saccharimonadales bacterium]